MVINDKTIAAGYELELFTELAQVGQRVGRQAPVVKAAKAFRAAWLLGSPDEENRRRADLLVAVGVLLDLEGK
jgi:hypothetical protein